MSDLVRKTKLYVGTQPKINDGVVSTNPKHLNGTTQEIGFTIDPASATDPYSFVELYVGVEQNVNAGVVTTNPNHMNGATRPIGYVSVHPIQGGTELFVGAGKTNLAVVTTVANFLGSSTREIGFTMPS